MKKFFETKASEMPLWQLFLLVTVAGFVAYWLYDMLFVENIIVTANNGSFEKKSFWNPLTAEEKVKIGVAFDEKTAKAAADKAASEKK